MPSTYEPIATSTLGSAQSNIEFTSIPNTYTDLVIAGGLRVDNAGSGAENMLIRFNGDTGSNYSITYMLGDGSSGGYGSFENFDSFSNSSVGNSDTNLYSVELWHINNYANTTTYKGIILGHFAQFGNQVQQFIGTWRSTSAITSIKIFPSGSKNLASGSTLTLYGIKAA
jgi:hypothetical protein